MRTLMSVVALIAGLGLAVAVHTSGPSPAVAQKAAVLPAPAVPVIRGADMPSAAALSDWHAPWSAPSVPLDNGFAGSDMHAGWQDRQSLGSQPIGNTGTVAMGGDNARQGNSIGHVERAVLAPVPEPQSWALFIIGMLLVGYRLRRRRPAPQPNYLETL